MQGNPSTVAKRSSEDGLTSWRNFENLVAHGGGSPFYVLYGKERYFIRKAASLLKQRILPSPDLCELLYHPVYGPEANGAELAQLGQTVPFFERTRLVLVWDAEKFKEKDQGQMQSYAENPAPFTCMVFAAGDAFPKGPLFACLKDRYPGACFGFPGLKPAQCLRWLQERAKEKGLGSRVHPELLEGLLSGGPAGLEALENQLEILALYLHEFEGNRISDSLPFGFPDISLGQAYRLTDPLLRGDIRNVLDILNRFVGQGVPPLILLSLISGEVRKLWQLKEEMAKGPVPDSVLKSFRIQPFKKAEYVSLAGRLSWRSLGGMLFSLGRTDRLLKSSRLHPQLHLEDLCRRVTQGMTADSAH